MDDPRNAALEAAIEADPFDREAYRVYADWLEEQGDVRAKLIALQCGSQPAPNAGKAVRKLLAENQRYLLGALARCAKALEWQFGFIHRATLSRETGALDLANLFAHPSGRFLVELGVAVTSPTVIAKLAAAPKTIRTLSLRSEVMPVVNVEPLAPVIARLFSLSLAGRFEIARVSPAWLRTLALSGRIELEPLDLPELETASFELDQPSRATTAAIAESRWPKLSRLVLGGAFDPRLLAPLFSRVPALTDLSIRGATDGEALAALLRDAPFAGQLRRLELSRGTLTDAAARVLAAGAAAFDQLDELDACDNSLTEDGYAALDTMGVVDLLDDRRYDDAGE